MILLDISQISIANIMMSPEIAKGVVDIPLIKSMILRSIKSYKQQFSAKYGKIVICCDGHDPWRKIVLPHYKCHRKKTRDDSFVNWSKVYEAIGELKEDLKQNFPYKVLDIPHVEADDIIGVLSKKYHEDETILIVSSDKDHMQLQKFSNVEQYCPRTKLFKECGNPVNQLRELIIRGDRGDSIPNIKSPDDVFVSGKRSGSITTTFLTECMFNDIPKEYEKNFERNRKLIDYDAIPDGVSKKVLESFEVDPIGNKQKLMQYFIQNKMKSLICDIGQF